MTSRSCSMQDDDDEKYSMNSSEDLIINITDFFQELPVVMRLSS